MSPAKRFSLPRKKNLKTIDISNCQSIKRVNELPKGITGYSGYYQANQCDAKLDKTKIKKSENNTEVKEARIFCDQLQSPFKGKGTIPKKKPELIKEYGQSKGGFYYEHDTFSYEGRKGNVCEVAFQIKDPNDKIIHTLYESNKIFLSKLHK